jgi:hypothetical protein
MKRITKALLFVGIVGLSFSSLLAQTATQGAVQDQEFVIRKDRVLSLPTRLRSFEKLPVLPQPKGLDPFTYTVTPFFLPLPALVKEAEPLLKENQPPKIDAYPGLVTLGYGNFISPLAEVRYGSTTSEKWHFASRFFHQGYGKGPVTSLGEESPESHTVLGGQGSYFLGKSEVFSELSLSRDRYTFYGEELVWYDIPNAMLLRPFFERNNQDRGQFSLGIRDVEKVGQLGYEAKLMLRGFKDSFSAREQEFGAKGKINFKPTDHWTANVGLAYFSSATKDATYDLTRNYLSIRPELTHTRGDLRVTAGVLLVAENDSLAEGEKGLRLFPLLKSQYRLSEQLGLFATLTGDVQRNTYGSFVLENPFLGPSEQLRNTVTQLKVGAGVEGQLWERLQYSAGLDISRHSNLHFFMNSYADTSRFELVYDQEATVFQFNSSVALTLTEKYVLTTTLDFFHYNLSNQQVAWHRPTWTLQMNQRYAPFKKLNLQANLNVMGGLQARGFGVIETKPVKVEVVKLPALVDLQFKADYAVSSRLSIFAEGNNLLNKQNIRWMNYPVRRFQGLAGLSFKF